MSENGDAGVEGSTLLIENIPLNLSEDDIYSAFAPTTVVKCQLVLDANSKSTGSAKVFVESKEEAEKIIKAFNKSLFFGKVIRVKFDGFFPSFSFLFLEFKNNY